MNRSQSHSNTGFSLVEVMIALGIFAFASMSATHGIVNLQVTSRALTLEQLVDETINGYIAQLNATDFEELDAASRDDSITTISVENNLTLMSHADSSMGLVEAALTLDEWTEHELLGHYVEKNGQMEATRPTVEARLSIVPHKDMRYLKARIDYRWESPMSRGTRKAFREFIISDPSNSLR